MILRTASIRVGLVPEGLLAERRNERFVVGGDDHHTILSNGVPPAIFFEVVADERAARRRLGIPPCAQQLAQFPHVLFRRPVGQAEAIERPSEVLPTPGGPTRHRIGPFLFGASLRTARYSTMRFLTFSRPQ